MKLGEGAGAVAAALVLAACTSSGGQTSNLSKLPDDGCTAVVVATSSEKVNLMEDLGRAFKQSPEHKALATCASVVPINVSSGTGAQILAADPTSWPLKDQNYWPTIWSPASTVWTDRVVAAGGEHLVAGAESFARTPVVFAVPQTMATALGYPAKPIGLPEIEKLISDPEGWGSVGKPLWGSFKIAKTNPNTSTTGLSVILMQSYAASKKAKHLTVADVQKSAAFSRVFESGAIHYGDTTGKVLQTLYNATQNGAKGSGYVSAVAVEEASLFNYNLGNPDSHTVQPGEKLTPPKEKLVAVYPSGGSMWSDNPAVVLGAPWVTPAKQAAGQAFLKFLKTRPAQELLPKYGFRPLDTSVDVSQYLNAEVGIDPAKPTIALPEPSADVVSAAIDQWADIRKPSAILELIDISGSMDEAAGDGRSKLDGAIDGAQSTLGNFRRTDEIGLWAFTTGIKSDHGANVVPVREFAPLGGDRETMKSSVADLRHTGHGGTPLYDAVATAYDDMVKHAETGRINAIVVLSDGQDTDSDLSLDSLLIKIGSSAKEGTAASPVRIFTIAYGKSADTGSLGRISKASGGQLFDATDPTRIDAVFASVINNF
jgi:Ca-activated chloride channel family protein